ncbi:MAG: Gfo/Idh/MocA family oxidoreductase [Oscillospiraceae bacterium]|nr:Gfo/Idh/MocA family oxidoreductase [Oscillospiraceae bacterium]
MAQFKVILAGCGGMGNAWMSYMKKRDDVEIVGLCDIVIERTAEYAKKYNLSCKVFDEISKALAACPEANLVVDCTTPDAHELIVTSALNAGADAIGEKPMAETREQALRQIAVSDKTGRSYAVMQNRIYLPGMRAIRKALGENILGRVGSVSSDFFIGAHFGGFRDLMDNVLVLDMAVHTFYQARFLIGANPKSAYCHEFNPPGSWYRGNASAIAIFEFENGAVYDYRGSWCSEGFNTSWECDWRIVGEKGTIKWDGGQKLAAQIKKEGESGFVIPADEIKIAFADDGMRHGHEGCFDEMFAALSEKRPAETDCHENYHSMNMVYGAIESAKYGKKVML